MKKTRITNREEDQKILFPHFLRILVKVYDVRLHKAFFTTGIFVESPRDNEEYWIKRHDKHQNKMVSVGNIGKNEEENLEFYARKKRVVFKLLKAINMPDLTGRSVLDAGCGIGLVSELFYALGADTAGIDASEKAAHYARHRAPEGTFVQASIVDFSFDKQFDIVFSADVLYHVIDDANWAEAVLNLFDHVKPGGWLILIDQLHPEVTSPAKHVRFRTRKMYQDLMAGKPASEVIIPEHARVVLYRKS